MISNIRPSGLVLSESDWPRWMYYPAETSLSICAFTVQIQIQILARRDISTYLCFYKKRFWANWATVKSDPANWAPPHWGPNFLFKLGTSLGGPIFCLPSKLYVLCVKCMFLKMHIPQANRTGINFSEPWFAIVQFSTGNSRVPICRTKISRVPNLPGKIIKSPISPGKIFQGPKFAGQNFPVQSSSICWTPICQEPVANIRDTIFLEPIKHIVIYWRRKQICGSDSGL